MLAQQDGETEERESSPLPRVENARPNHHRTPRRGEGGDGEKESRRRRETLALASASRERRPRSPSPARFAGAKPSKPFAYLELGHLCSTQSSAIVCASGAPLSPFSPSPLLFPKPNHDKTDFLLFLLGRLPPPPHPERPFSVCAVFHTRKTLERGKRGKRARGVFGPGQRLLLRDRPPSARARCCP